MKKSFILYKDQWDMVEQLTNEQAGLLLKSLFLYTRCEDMPELDPVTKIAFASIKGQLLRDKSKWDEIRDSRVEAGRKGGHQTQAGREANASKCKQVQANQAVDVNVNVNVKEREYINTCKSILDYFNSVCRKSLSLSSVRKGLIITRLKEGKTEEQLKTAILNFSKDTWSERHKYCDLIYAIGQQKGKPDNFERWYNEKPAYKKIDLGDLINVD